MSKQDKKYTLGLAGEFLVAGELLRRGISAAVTYGNAKKADVIAVQGDRAVALEVKTTSQAKWVIGSKLPDIDNRIWIFVYLPLDETLSPEFFVSSSADLHALLLPGDQLYLEKYRKKHDTEFSGVGVVSLQRKLLDKSYLGAWRKVSSALDSSSSSAV